jgi:hypothetical protein
MARCKGTNPENKRPTPRQLALLKNLSMGCSITEAARKAGYSEKWPGQAGYQALQNLKVKMPELLDRLGLNEAMLIEKHLKPLLRAQTTKFFQHDGKVRDKRVVAANEIRLQALDMAFRLRGSYAPKGAQPAEQRGVTVIVLDVPRPNRSAIPINPGTPNEGNREERLAVGTPAPGGPAEAGTCTRLSPGEDLPAKKRSRVAQKPLRAFPKAVTVGSPLFRLRRLPGITRKVG